LDSARLPKGDDSTAVRLKNPGWVREGSGDTVHVRISQNPRHGHPSRISQGATWHVEWWAVAECHPAGPSMHSLTSSSYPATSLSFNPARNSSAPGEPGDVTEGILKVMPKKVQENEEII